MENSQVVVVHTINPSTWEAEAGISLGVGGQPDLQSEFQYSQGYTEKPRLEKQTNKNLKIYRHMLIRYFFL